MNDLTPQEPQPQHQLAPFGQVRGHGLPSVVNQGAVAIEQERAIAEARGQMQLAKMFPRDTNAAYAELMEACKLPALAQVAFYNVPRGGGKVSGPSIRLAEEIARVYGNFEYGHRELSRGDGKSEVEVYAWDKEKNNRSIRQITVQHTMDTKEGPKKLRDQKDVDDKIANVASKQVRGRILALVPKWMVESAIEECKKTLAGNNSEPISVRVRKMTQAFAAFGVTAEHLETYLGHKLDTVLADELVDLIGIFNSIKEGAPASEFFKPAEQGADAAQQTAAQTAEAIKATAAKGASTKAATAKPAQKDEKPKDAQPSEPVKSTDQKPQQEPAVQADAAEQKGQGSQETPSATQPTAQQPQGSPGGTAPQADEDVF